MDPVSLTIHLETDEVMGMLDELATMLIEKSVDIPYLPTELISIQPDDGPARAGELVMRLYPTDRLSGFMSALRAR